MARLNDITCKIIIEETKSASSPADRPYDGYNHLEARIRESFEEAVANKESLFVTDATDLYNWFLHGLPAEARQHYNCNACRRFVDSYGGLVRILPNGDLDPIMWNFIPPEFFRAAVGNVRHKVLNSRVIGVFITSERRLGVAQTGIWTHMAVDMPKSMIHNSRLNTAYQAAAKINEEFKMLQYAVNKYSISTAETAVNLLRSDSLYRGEKTLGIAEWFLEVLKTVQCYTGNRRTNYLWLRAATAPSGFCHVSSSMIGTLLDDIQEGYDFKTVKARFNVKMDPLKYQRPQVAPGRANVARAEEIIAKLGMQNSLKRRFAQIHEVQLEWVPSIDFVAKLFSGGVFAGVKTKDDEWKEIRDRKIQPEATTMTWYKFRREVLPHAKKIELFIPGYKNSYAALVTAADPFAPPIIVWDNENLRNPVNWYMYNGGSHAYQWNLPDNEYVEVTGITMQPNMWQPGFEHHGKGVFFLLKGCKDTQNHASALFPETLKGELREIRATIEAYSGQHKLDGFSVASACGLALQEGSRVTWNCKLKVTTDVGVRYYKLDRWD